MISKIIDDLSNSDISLIAPLLKIKVLAKRIKNEPLFKLVSNEIEGYQPDDDIPKYRLPTAIAYATIQQNGNTFTDNPIPFTIFEIKLRELLTTFPILLGVESIENLIKDKNDGVLEKPFGADFAGFLSTKARDVGQSLFFSEVRITCHISQIVGIISTLRSKFLDLMLAIETDYPEIDGMINKPMKEDNEISRTISHHMANINITGDGNVINTGLNSTINVKTKINKNDLVAFQEALRKLNISEDDIQEISGIVQNEAKKIKDNVLDIKSQSWINKMISKAKDGSWEIALNTVAGTLTSIISKFYGLV